MNVVTCYEAAKIAKVSKQIMSSRKKVNSLDKSKYKYFAFDSISGDFGVDTDHIEWKRYMTKRRSTPKFKNDTVKNTEGHSIVNTNPDYVNKNNMLHAVVNALRKNLKLTGKEMKAITDQIAFEYEELEK